MTGHYEQQQNQEKIRHEVYCTLFPLLHNTTEEEFISNIQFTLNADFEYVFNIITATFCFLEKDYLRVF